MPTLIAILIFAAWFAFAWAKPRTAFSCLPFALPFYLVRLKIGPLPTTALEMVVLATVAARLLSILTRKVITSNSKENAFHPERVRERRIPWQWKSMPSKESFARGLAQDDKWRIFRYWMLPCGLWLLAGAISVIVPADHIAALGLYRAYFVEPVVLFFVGVGLMSQEENGKWKMENGSNGKVENGKWKMALKKIFHFPFSIFHFPNTITSNLAILTILLSAWAISQYLTGIGLPAEYAPAAIRRSVGPFPYPNALALFVVPIVALAFAGQVTSHESRVTSSLKNPSTLILPPWLGWTTVVAGLIAIVLAKSDGGLIAVIAAMGVALVMNKRTRLATIAVAVICAIAVFAIPQVRTPVLDQILFREWSGKVRVIMWKETVTMLKDRPIFGAGLAAYPTAIKPYHKATWMEIFQYPHDILLNLWSETGVLGVIAFGWILITWVRRSVSPYVRRSDLRTYGLTDHLDASGQALRASLPIIVALLVHGIVDVPYFKNDLAIVFWLLLLITSTIQQYNNTTILAATKDC